MPDFTLKPVAGHRKLRVQAWAPGSFQAPAALNDATGAAWPQGVGAVAEGHCRVLCIGPTDWIVVAPETTASRVHEAIQALAPSAQLSVVEVTDALPHLQLEGASVRDVLSQGCGLDLHPKVFTAGQCARTRLAQIPAILHCIDGGSAFDCYVSRSYLPHLESWLRDAAQDAVA
jgi:sarcosine oxidase subunit gamma